MKNVRLLSLWALGVFLTVLALAGGCARGGAFTLPGPREAWHFHGLAVDPFDSRILWVATHTGLVRWVEDQGWEVVGPPNDHMGFAVHPTERGVLYSSGHPGPGVRLPNPLGLQVSRDGGKTWRGISLVGEADFHILAISPANPRLLYGYNVYRNPGLYRSEDGGLTWQRLGRPEVSLLSLAPHPQEPDTLLAATFDGLLVSQKKGERASWKPLHTDLMGVPVTAVAYHPRDPRVIYAFAAPPKGALLVSKDGGSTWERLPYPGDPQDVVMYIAPDHSSPRLFVATMGVTLYLSPDGGKTWEVMLEKGREVRPARR